MKIINAITLISILTLLATNIGCSGRAMVTSSAPPQQPIRTELGKPITSEACGFQLFDVIPIMTNSRHERAWNMLVKESRGEYITNVKVNDTWVYMLVGHSYCTTIRATSFPYKQ